MYINCVVTAISTLECTPNAPPATYSIAIHIANYGYATGTLSYTLALSVISVTAPDTSYAGGLSSQVVGTGLYENSVVKVCGFKCELEHIVEIAFLV